MPIQLNFTKTSLIVPETRVVAGLLLDEVDDATWQQRIVGENILQKRTVNTAKSYATIARHRLETMRPELWEMVRDAQVAVATQAVLAATLKFSSLLALFMRTSLADEYRRMSPTLDDGIWNGFISDQAIDHGNLADASEGTLAKLRQNAFRILTEAGYLGLQRTHPLQHVRIFPEIRNYLVGHKETDVLAAMECAQ